MDVTEWKRANLNTMKNLCGHHFHITCWYFVNPPDESSWVPHYGANWNNNTANWEETGPTQDPTFWSTLQLFVQKQHWAHNVPTCVLIKPMHQAGEPQYRVIYACVSSSHINLGKRHANNGRRHVNRAWQCTEVTHFATVTFCLSDCHWLLGIKMKSLSYHYRAQYPINLMQTNSRRTLCFC